MIKEVILAIFLTYPIIAEAQVLIKSGEHDGFTRFVMDYKEPVSWRLGRSEDGYELHVERRGIEYDFSKVYRPIGKDRLASIWADQASGALKFSLACSCHAKAFEFRQGIIVVDINDGTAPKNSPFEALISSDINQKNYPKLEARENTAESDIKNYNWIENYFKASTSGRDSKLHASLEANVDPDLQASEIRDHMLNQLSRGASRGVINLKDLSNSQDSNFVPPGAPMPINGNSVRSGLNELPGISFQKEKPRSGNTSSAGSLCIESERLDISSWSGDSPVWQQISQYKEGVLEEFDEPNTDAVDAAVKFLLSVGFGSEARQLIDSFPSELRDRKLWRAMSYIVDEDSDPSNFFAGQTECGTAAALWATLGSRNDADSAPINSDAVILEFSALSVEMRMLFGPTLIQKFIDQNMASSAEKVKNAILRTPDGIRNQKLLIEATLNLFENNAVAAESKAQSALADSGPETWLAIVTMIDARAAQNIPIEAELLVALEAVSRELLHTDNEAKISRALVLAYALTGDFQSAFSNLPTTPSSTGDLWRILSVLGTDDDILIRAVMPDDKIVGSLSADTKDLIATRLMGLGMVHAAMAWGGGSKTIDKSQLAEMFLLQGNATDALSVLGDQSVETSLNIRALALQRLGKSKEAAELFALGKNLSGELSALRQMDNWDATLVRSPEPWKSVMELLDAGANAAELSGVGPLAKSLSLIDDSKSTTAAIQELLALQVAN